MIPDRDGDSDSGMTFHIFEISLSHTPKLGVELKFVHHRHFFEALGLSLFHDLRELPNRFIEAVKVCVDKDFRVAFGNCELPVAYSIAGAFKTVKLEYSLS